MPDVIGEMLFACLLACLAMFRISRANATNTIHGADHWNEAVDPILHGEVPVIPEKRCKVAIGRDDRLTG